MFTFLMLGVGALYVGVAYANKNEEGWDWKWPVAYISNWFN